MSSNEGTAKTVNDRPIIGIVALDAEEEGNGKTFIPSHYVSYLEMAGARVVAIRGDQSRDYYEKMVHLTNGIVFPGGESTLKDSIYARSATHVFEIALRINKEGDFYPLWGTCLGLQIMAFLVAGEGAVTSTDAEFASFAVDFTPEADKSRLLGAAPDNIKDILQHEKVTPNIHCNSVLMDTFNSTKLASFFNVLTTNKDRKGVEYISTFEAKDFPFYGVQWHPEKITFDWNPKCCGFNHGAHAIQVSQYMANFFVDEARKSSHHFPDIESETQSLIEYCKRVIVNNDAYFENYYID